MKPHQSGQREQCSEKQQRIREGTEGGLVAHPEDIVPQYPKHPAEHGRYATTPDNVRRRHRFSPVQTSLQDNEVTKHDSAHLPTICLRSAVEMTFLIS